MRLNALVRSPLGKYQALVSKRVLDLLPTFFRNRRHELECLRQALAARDFEQLRHLAHRMRGVGGSYGFDHVTTLGREIEQCARYQDVARIAELLTEYADYLTNVRIEHA